MDNNDDVIEMLENHKLNTEQIINEMVRSLKEANKRLKMTQDEDGILELKAKLSTMEKENSCLLEHNQHYSDTLSKVNKWHQEEINGYEADIEVYRMAVKALKEELEG